MSTRNLLVIYKQISIMTGLISIIGLIVAVLNIILFFKLWGMTNDIREMKENQLRRDDIEDIPQLRAYLRSEVIMGNTENAKKALIGLFKDNINALCNPSGGAYLSTTDKRMDTDITPYVKLLEKQLAKLNMEVPETIRRMKTFRDYYEFFTDEDFKI